MKDKLLHINMPFFKSKSKEKILNHDAHFTFTSNALMLKL